MYPQRPEEGIRTTGTGITGGCELSDVGAVNQPTSFVKAAHPSNIKPQEMLLLKEKTNMNWWWSAISHYKKKSVPHL